MDSLLSNVATNAEFVARRNFPEVCITFKVLCSFTSGAH